MKRRAHPDLNQGPADLQSAALAAELCTLLTAWQAISMYKRKCGRPTMGEKGRDPGPSDPPSKSLPAELSRLVFGVPPKIHAL